MKTINKLLEQRWKLIRTADRIYYTEIAAYQMKQMRTLPRLTLRKKET